MVLSNAASFVPVQTRSIWRGGTAPESYLNFARWSSFSLVERGNVESARMEVETNAGGSTGNCRVTGKENFEPVLSCLLFTEASGELLSWHAWPNQQSIQAATEVIFLMETLAVFVASSVLPVREDH